MLKFEASYEVNKYKDYAYISINRCNDVLNYLIISNLNPSYIYIII